MTTLRSSCCKLGQWHAHSADEWHQQADNDYHLVTWDTRKPDNKGSCGWAFYYGCVVFEGHAQDPEDATRIVEEAVKIHQDMMAQMLSLGLTRTGWER